MLKKYICLKLQINILTFIKNVCFYLWFCLIMALFIDLQLNLASIFLLHFYGGDV